MPPREEESWPPRTEAEDAAGESIVISSLMADELPRGRNVGGGVCVSLLQDPLAPRENGSPPVPNAPNNPFVLAELVVSKAMLASSGTSSRVSAGNIDGDD